MLAPTRELAIQVAEAFERYAAHLPGLHVLPIYGGQGYGVQLSALRRGVHVVVGTPGRVIDHLEKGTLDLSELRFLVLDEADEMLRMGFAEDVETILADTPDDKQVALFSATMPAQIRRIAKKYLTDSGRDHGQDQDHDRGQHQPALLQVVAPAEARRADPDPRGRELRGDDHLRPHQAGHRGARRAAAGARASRPPRSTATSSQAQRERTIDQLREGKLDILVATDVAARGLDVERISHVVNYDIPTDTESYVHRIGRTGRAGRTGEAHLVRHAARAAPAQGDRAGHPPAADARCGCRPSRTSTRTGSRSSRDAITEALGVATRSAFFRDLIDDYEQRARRAGRRHRRRAGRAGPGRPAAADGARAGAAPPRVFEGKRERTGGAGTTRRADARDRDDRPPRRDSQAAPAPLRTCRWRRTGSRSASGTRSSRGRSSARSPTRAAWSAATSGTSTSAATTRSSSCRRTCPSRPARRWSGPGSPAS